MSQYHGSLMIEVEFSFQETHKECGIGFDKSGQAIDPPSGPEWELEGFTVTAEDINSYESSKVLYEEIVEIVNRHIEENYQDLTSN